MDKAMYEGLSGWIEWIVVLMGRPAIDVSAFLYSVSRQRSLLVG